MNAAIKAIEDTLTIRQLQARDLAHEAPAKGSDPAGQCAHADRLASLQKNIESLERGLRLLTEADAGRQTTDAGGTKNEEPRTKNIPENT